MRTDYIVSTNIERDATRELNYILTPNAKDIFDRIISNYKVGNHSFNIIGSYGTGKSSFLWALEKNLIDKRPIFAPLNGQFGGLQEFEFIKFVGESSSFKKQFSSKLRLDEGYSDTDIFRALDAKYAGAAKKKKVLVIIVDEFGKYLEFASKNDPDQELYFVQQLSEYANHPDKQILFITTLHQNFGTYSKGLSSEQRLEWEKVKGRITDLAFDEPVEQLLFFAAERLDEIKLSKELRPEFDGLYKLIDDSKLLPSLNLELAEKLFPLDYLAAYVLTSALQRYGQNERSLFTFLSSPDDKGIQSFEGDIFNVSDVFDYLARNMSSEISDPGNPHKAQWQALKIGLEKAEVMLEDDFSKVAPIIKTIGLVNIFGKSAGDLGPEMLSNYLNLANSLTNASELIDRLLKKKIIKFFHHRNKLNFLDGTDADLDQELLNAGKNIEAPNVAEALKQYVSFPYLPAKAYQYKYGTPRFFEFQVSNGFETVKPEGQLDGYINLIFSPGRIKGKIIEKSATENEAQIYVLYEDVEEISFELFEILKHEYVIEHLQDDRVAAKLLEEQRKSHIDNLNNLVVGGLYDNSENVTWIYKKQLTNISSKKDLNKLLTYVCEDVYGIDIKVRNELINRESLSTPIRTARKALLKHLLDYSNEADLGFDEKRFPPEKTIYLSLIRESGIHRNDGKLGWGIYEPKSEDLRELWNIGEQFMQDSKTVKQSLQTFLEMFTEGPKKVKMGLAEFWMYIYLIAKREEYALFHVDSGYVPYLSSDVLDLIFKKPANYQIKSYNVSGVKLNLFNKYQEITNLSDQTKSTKETFISIFRQFSLFYRGLPEYAINTKNVSASARGLRTAISNAKDPETALFEEFPAALGFHDLKLKDADDTKTKDYVSQLSKAIAELRGAMDELYDKVEICLISALHIKNSSFEAYQKQVHKLFKSLNPDLLTQTQRKFYMRLMSPLDERNLWLKSISDEIIGKKIETIRDEEESLLLENLIGMLHNLERLIDIHALKASKKDDEVVRIDLLDASGENKFDVFAISKEQNKEAANVEKELNEVLKSQDNEVILAALYNMLNKKLK